MRDDLDNTMYFDKNNLSEQTPREILARVYDALEEKGYQPVNQIVGYLLSGDPAYITSYHGARSLIKQFGRDEFVEAMLRDYLGLPQGKR